VHLFQRKWRSAGAEKQRQRHVSSENIYICIHISIYIHTYIHTSIMARLVLGKIEFEVDPNCEELDARCYEVPDADVAVLGERMARGEFGRLRALDLVSCSAFVAFFAWC
jgi:hypothetical protein